ncbi:transporter [Elizabethkingia anophelis]|jgi:outer membrane protein TolC|uniref:TolC family protein n=1 Tax=Chryseobacterium group TaxID=2782232 RepID=UPI0024B7E95E|nr:TolC family protein [Epilithonimonas pallida]MDV3585716.1 transporter [Elizabethkingia anophelis]MDV3679256.1 transporter [Elizabethkingia anophelis]
MIQKIKILLPVILLYAGTVVQAQVMSLQRIIDSISVHHPVVKMYDNEIRSMDENAKGARSWMAPQVGVGNFMTPYNVDLWRKKDGMTGMGSVAFSVEQMIPNKKKLDANEAYMKAMSSTQKEKKNAQLNELVQDAKQLYYDWIILEKKLSVIKENQSLLNFMIKNAEIRYQNGLSKISAYYKAKASLGNIKNMQLMYENDIKEKRIRLNALMNRNAMLPLEIDTSFQFNDYADLVFDKDLFYKNRSDLKALDKEINIANLQQENEKQSLKPEFGFRYENMVGFGGQPLQYTAMIMIKLPFVSWASKMNKANIESLKWKASSLESQKEMMVNEYSGMAYGMRNEFDLNKKQIELYEQEIIPALKNNYKSMQLGYEQNTEELFMLFDAWEQLNMTQIEYFDLYTKALTMQVTLDRLIEKK